MATTSLIASGTEQLSHWALTDNWHGYDNLHSVWCLLMDYPVLKGCQVYFTVTKKGTVWWNDDETIDSIVDMPEYLVAGIYDHSDDGPNKIHLASDKRNADIIEDAIYEYLKERYDDDELYGPSDVHPQSWMQPETPWERDN
jgi:hypothetical protein